MAGKKKFVKRWPYLNQPRRIVHHGELHEKLDKRWCKAHTLWIRTPKWDKHVMCDVVNQGKLDKAKKPRGHALRKIKGATPTSKKVLEQVSRKPIMQIPAWAINKRHGDLGRGGANFFCAKHIRFVPNSAWDKHHACARRGTRVVLSKAGKKAKRTSDLVKYCYEHGKFVGFQWGGHRKRCRSREMTPEVITIYEALLAKGIRWEDRKTEEAEKLIKELQESSNAKPPAAESFADFSQREAFWTIMKKVGVTGGMFEKRKVFGFRVSSAEPWSALRVDDFITVFGTSMMDSPGSVIKDFFEKKHDGQIQVAVLRGDVPSAVWVTTTILEANSKTAGTFIPMAESIPSPLLMEGSPILLEEQAYPLPPLTVENQALKKVFRVLGIKKGVLAPLSCLRKTHKEGRRRDCPTIRIEELYENSVLKEQFPEKGHIIEVNNVDHFDADGFAREVISCMKQGGHSLNLGVVTCKYGKYGSEFITVNLPSLEQAFEEDIFVPTDNVVFKVEHHLKDLDVRISNRKALLLVAEKNLKMRREEADALALQVSRGVNEIQQLESQRKEFTSKLVRVLKFAPK